MKKAELLDNLKRLFPGVVRNFEKFIFFFYTYNFALNINIWKGKESFIWWTALLSATIASHFNKWIWSARVCKYDSSIIIIWTRKAKRVESARLWKVI